jgi:hypothetical protein
VGTASHDDASIPDEAHLFLAYWVKQLLPPLEPEQNVAEVEFAELNTRVKKWGFASREDRYSRDIGLSVFVEERLPSPQGPARLSARFNEKDLPKFLVRLHARSVRHIEPPDIKGGRLGIVWAPIRDQDDPFYDFRRAHAHILKPDRTRFTPSLTKRLAAIARVALV